MRMFYINEGEKLMGIQIIQSRDKYATGDIKRTPTKQRQNDNTKKTNKMSNSEFSVMTGNMFLFHIRHHRVKSSSSFVRERGKEKST